MTQPCPGLFITGTDTGVGKTAVAAAIARILASQGHRVGVLKPVATGATREGEAWRCEDAEALIAAVGGGVAVERVTPIAYEPPLAPPVAARLAGAPLLWERLRDEVSRAMAWWADQGVDVMVVEGVGGFLCPLAEGATVADLALALDFPMVIVGRRGLGTLNHCLLTIEAARLRSLRIAGVVLNGSDATANTLAEATNAVELSRHLGPIPLLAEIPHSDNSTHHAIISVVDGVLRHVDWIGRARTSRQPADPAANDPQRPGS